MLPCAPELVASPNPELPLARVGVADEALLGAVNGDTNAPAPIPPGVKAKLGGVPAFPIAPPEGSSPLPNIGLASDWTVLSPVLDAENSNRD